MMPQRLRANSWFPRSCRGYRDKEPQLERQDEASSRGPGGWPRDTDDGTRGRPGVSRRDHTLGCERSHFSVGRLLLEDEKPPPRLPHISADFLGFLFQN